MRVRIHFIRSIITLAAFTAGIAFAQNDWPSYAVMMRGRSATRPSPKSTLGNVQQVDASVEVRDEARAPGATTGGGRQGPGSTKTTPLMVNNVLYFATPASVPGSGRGRHRQEDLELRSPARRPHLARNRVLARRS